MRRRYGTFSVTQRGFATGPKVLAEPLLLKSTLVSCNYVSWSCFPLSFPSSSFHNVDDANRWTFANSQMRLILGLYDVHTAFALANNVHSTGFELNYRPARPLPTPTPMPTLMLPLRTVPTLAAYPTNRAQRPSVNGRALNSSPDLRRLRLPFRPNRLTSTQLPCSICYRRLRRHMT